MRCDVVRKRIEQEMELPAEMDLHLAACTACADYRRRWRLIRSGFAELGKQEPPEASVGFAERLVRRLGSVRDISPWGQSLIVEAGRRVVYATLFVALVLILGLVLPSSGPLRSPQAAQSILSEPEVATMSADQIFGISDASLPESAAASTAGQEGDQPQ